MYLTPWLSLSLACASTAPGASESGLYNIAHMVNTTDAVDWAIRSGANAVEMDLRFDADGAPTEFRHGGSCDCLCYCPFGACSTLAPDNVCAQLERAAPSACEAATPAKTMLAHVASSASIALLFVDGKVGSGHLPAEALPVAGRNAVDLLEAELFERGFLGGVVLTVPSSTEVEYLAAAAERAAETAHGARIYFTIDGEGSRGRNVLETLAADVPSRNRVYGTGVSACAPFQYRPAVRLGAAHEGAGFSALTYVWTVDNPGSIMAYLSDGARGVMTNVPARQAALFAAAGLPLATPGQALPDVTNDLVVSSAR